MENESNQVMPSNNMTLAIVGTILGMCSPCCIGFVLGIVAIVMAKQVKKKFNDGDVAGAETSSKNAKILAYVAIGLMVVTTIYYALNWEDFMSQIQAAIDQVNQ